MAEEGVVPISYHKQSRSRSIRLGAVVVLHPPSSVASASNFGSSSGFLKPSVSWDMGRFSVRPRQTCGTPRYWCELLAEFEIRGQPVQPTPATEAPVCCARYQGSLSARGVGELVDSVYATFWFKMRPSISTSTLLILCLGQRQRHALVIESVSMTTADASFLDCY